MDRSSAPNRMTIMNGVKLTIFLSCTLSLATSCRRIEVENSIGPLTVDLLSKTAQNDRNTIFSAYSISTALGMCLLGAAGETASQMRATLHLDLLDRCKISSGYKASLTRFNSVSKAAGKNFSISVANRLYVQQTTPLKPTYQKEVRSVFQADALNVDFRNNASGVTNQINLFVKEKTFGLIPQLLTQPLEPATVLTLINCLYFRGSWDFKFMNSSSREFFNPTSRSPTRPSWMNYKGGLYFYKSCALQATLVELPYVGNPNSPAQLSMVVVMPDENFASNVTAWMKSQLSWDLLLNEIDMLHVAPVNLTMPKFSVEQSFELGKTLSELGMGTAFSDNADFRGLLANLSLKVKISRVVHQAKMKVDEKGTEAAAATGVVVGPTGAAQPPRYINVLINRPFLAFIMLYDRCSDDPVPLFSAVVNQV